MSDAEPPVRFILVPADLVSLVADKRLSKDAAWLYVVLLSHHNRSRADDNVWPSRAALARAMGLKKPDSVDGYLKELRDAGLILTNQRRRAGNMKASSRHTLLLTVPRTDEEGGPIPSADTPPSGYRYPRQRGADTLPTGQELDEGELPLTSDSDMSCTTSGRFAPFGGGASKTQNQDDPWAVVNSPRTSRHDDLNDTERTDWRGEDRELFRSLVGQRLRSGGGRWNKGEWSADDFYKAFRKRGGRKPLEWPGRYLQAMVDSGGNEEVIEDWLIDQGLEQVE